MNIEPEPAASRRIADHVRDAILRGEIRPGDRIRQEDVAGRFGASRLPVREALRMLEAEELLELRPNKGARIPKLSLHEVDVIYRMRERLEPLALEESIPHLTAADVERLGEIQDRIERVTDLAEFLPLDREFHLFGYAACPIDRLTSTIHRLWNATQPYRRAYMRLSGPDRRWVVNAEHRLLLDAITRRDTADAERFLTGHIRRTRVELARHPEAFE